MIRLSDKALDAFIRNSNRIEGIEGDPRPQEIEAHQMVLRAERVDRLILSDFVYSCAGAPIRAGAHQNVSVGNHIAPRGGEQIITALEGLLRWTVFSPKRVHDLFLWLHPYMDGNGRASRVLWLRKALRLVKPAEILNDPLGFFRHYLEESGRTVDSDDFYVLRRAYYDTLEQGDDATKALWETAGFKFGRN